MTARDFLAAVQQRADAATDGPWNVTDGRGIHSRVYRRENQREVQDDHERRIAHYVEPDDAEFIAASRMDVPRLVAALTAALDLADEYERDDREHLDRFGQHHPVAHHPYPHIRAAITAALTPKENDS